MIHLSNPLCPVLTVRVGLSNNHPLLLGQELFLDWVEVIHSDLLSQLWKAINYNWN